MANTSHTSASALVQRVWNYAHVLKDDGLAFMDYTEQITYLLFLKMSWEQRQTGASEIPARYTWGALQNITDNAKRLDRYHQGLRKLSELPGLIGLIFTKPQSKINDPAKLHLLIQMIDSEEWSTLDVDVKGEVYEGLLAKNADDVRGGAFQFYFARPVTREQYLIGKLLPPVLLVFFVTAAPALLLSILRIALAKDGADALASIFVPLETLAMGVLLALSLGVPVVALSSLSRGRGYVQGAFAALFLLPWIIGSLLVDVTQSGWGAVLSLPVHFMNVGRFLFQLDPEPGARNMPVWASATVLALLIVGSLALLRKRLAAVEVIGGS